LPPCCLHAFPTRRSSDLLGARRGERRLVLDKEHGLLHPPARRRARLARARAPRAAKAALLLRAVRALLRRAERLQALALGLGQRSEEHTSELQSRGHLVC